MYITQLHHNHHHHHFSLSRMNAQREMFQFGATLSEQPDELNLQKDDALQKHLHKRSSDPSAATHMNLKWNKPAAGDGSDHRRSFMPAGVGVQSSEFLTVNSSKHSWRTIGQAILDSKSSLNRKRFSPPNMWQQQQQQQQQQQLHQQNNKNDDSDDTDNTNNSSRPPSKYKRSPRNDSLHSKMSSHSFNEMMNESMQSYYNLQNKSSTFMDGDSKHDLSLNPNVSYKSLPNAGNWPSASKMNFIMLLGLIVGLVISKTLQYLQLYFGWFQSQVLQLRITLLGSISIFDFFNFEDNSRFGVRTKLLLLPVVATFSLIYGTIVFLHHVIRFLLTQAPSSLVNFIQKLYIDV